MLRFVRRRDFDMEREIVSGGGADEDTIRAGCTIAFHRLKPAHLMEKCAGYCGKTVCLSIGIDDVLNKNEKADSDTL